MVSAAMAMAPAVTIATSVWAAAIAVSFTVPVAPAVLVLGFIFCLLLAFSGPASKFRFSSLVISGFARSPYFLLTGRLVIARLHFRRVFRSGLCYLQCLGFLGLFRPCLRKRASAANDKAGEKCDG
jgi:hypothetical protein